MIYMYEMNETHLYEETNYTEDLFQLVVIREIRIDMHKKKIY